MTAGRLRYWMILLTVYLAPICESWSFQPDDSDGRAFLKIIAANARCVVFQLETTTNGYTICAWSSATDKVLWEQRMPGVATPVAGPLKSTASFIVESHLITLCLTNGSRISSIDLRNLAWPKHDDYPWKGYIEEIEKKLTSPEYSEDDRRELLREIDAFQELPWRMPYGYSFCVPVNSDNRMLILRDATFCLIGPMFKSFFADWVLIDPRDQRVLASGNGRLMGRTPTYAVVDDVDHNDVTLLPCESFALPPAHIVVPTNSPISDLLSRERDRDTSSITFMGLSHRQSATVCCAEYRGRRCLVFSDKTSCLTVLNPQTDIYATPKPVKPLVPDVSRECWHPAGDWLIRNSEYEAADSQFECYSPDGELKASRIVYDSPYANFHFLGTTELGDAIFLESTHPLKKIDRTVRLLVLSTPDLQVKGRHSLKLPASFSGECCVIPSDSMIVLVCGEPGLIGTMETDKIEKNIYIVGIDVTTAKQVWQHIVPVTIMNRHLRKK
ncbi:MAG: hypothetical protein C0404_04760 [Verrucomicrobia bacterium]|nr:hypothetical protein [Verrucomicrobiota bacterium]